MRDKLSLLARLQSSTAFMILVFNLGAMAVVFALSKALAYSEELRGRSVDVKAYEWGKQLADIAFWAFIPICLVAHAYAYAKGRRNGALVLMLTYVLAVMSIQITVELRG